MNSTELNELADELTRDIANTPPALSTLEEAARQLRHMATMEAKIKELKAQRDACLTRLGENDDAFKATNQKIQEWWWLLAEIPGSERILIRMEDFMHERSIPLERLKP